MSDYDPSRLDWLPQMDEAMVALTKRWRQRADRRFQASISSQGIELPTIPSGTQLFPPSISAPFDILLQAEVVRLDQKTEEGHLVAGVAVAWLEIIKQLERDQELLFKIPWRKLEEILAAAYERAGWPEVVLTPPSGDRGRDVIATRPGFGSIRIIDQVKAYKPSHVVTADEVRSMLGALQQHPNVSKGIVTTTGNFAPGIERDAGLAAFMPHRLELKNGTQLTDWLTSLAAQASGSQQKEG